MNKNQKRIAEICKKEDHIKSIKEWLKVLFVLLCIVVFVIVAVFIASVVNLNIEQEKVVMIKLIIALSGFAVAMFSGYLYDKFLSKKLDKLWEEKKKLF